MDLFNHVPFLSLIIVIPIAGAVFLMFSRFSNRSAAIFSLFTLGLTLFISLLFPLIQSPSFEGYHFAEKVSWVPTLGISYQLGLDGISYWFLELILSIALVCLSVSGFDSVQQTRGFFAAFLLLTSTTTGIVLATDIFLFIMFWGISIGLMFYLIPYKDERRVNSAAIRFLLFQFAGLVALLLAFIFLYIAGSRFSGGMTFSLSFLEQVSIPGSSQTWIFWLLWIGFAIRMGVFPFHSWLPHILDSVSVPIAVFLGAVSVKLGVYGILRFCIPLCPDAVLESSQTIIYLALISIVYGALLALVQLDMRKVVSFSCVSHMGFVMLGLFVLNRTGFIGSIYHSLAHGFSFSLLIILIAWISRHYGTSLIIDFGGMNKVYPAMAVFFLLAGFAYLGLPGLSGFPGIFMVFCGTVMTQPVWTLIALVGFLIGAAGILWMYQRIFTGPVSDLVESMEISRQPQGKAVFLLTAFLIIWLGLYPQFIVRDLNQPAMNLEGIIKSHHLLRESESISRSDGHPFSPAPPATLQEPYLSRNN
jgi:NADH-quinone oxidoreductase subunit M